MVDINMDIVYSIHALLINLLLGEDIMFTLAQRSSDIELANVISDYVASERIDSDKWKGAVSQAVENNCDAESWKEFYEKAEEEQAHMRETYNGEVIPRTKSTGKVIASKAFPKTWNTDKAIIGKALKEGVSLTDENGDIKPKTALQEEYKEAAAKTKPEKSAYEKLSSTVQTYKNLFMELNQEQREYYAEDLAKFHSYYGL